MSEYWAMAPAICAFAFLVLALVWKHGYWCGGRDEARRIASGMGYGESRE